MVKFNLAGDREKVMAGGPWMLFDHYLTVTRWTPEFVAPDATVDRTVVWIRFPGLNLVYYDERLLLALVATIGTPVRVDTNTLKVQRGRFARVCVEVDLSTLVVGKVCITGHWHKVQYEGLHIICGKCGCYGHYTRQCSADTHQNESVTVPANPPVMARAEDLTRPELTEEEMGINHNEKEEIVQPIPEIHGDWLVVTRRKRNQNQFKQGPRKSSYLAVNERPTGKSQPHMLKGKGSGQDLKGKKAQDMTTAWTSELNRIWASKKKRRHEGEAQLVVEMDSTPQTVVPTNSGRVIYVMKQNG